MFEPSVVAIFMCGLAVFLSMVLCVAVDVRERRIPRAYCYAIALAGSALQFVSFGMRGFLDGAVFGVFSVASALVLNRLLSRGDSVDAIGGGDIRCMFALSLATGSYAPVGFSACFLCAAVFGLLAGRRSRDGGKRTMPLAPYLSLWLVCGWLCPYALNF